MSTRGSLDAMQGCRQALVHTQGGHLHSEPSVNWSSMLVSINERRSRTDLGPRDAIDFDRDSAAAMLPPQFGHSRERCIGCSLNLSLSSAVNPLHIHSWNPQAPIIAAQHSVMPAECLQNGNGTVAPSGPQEA
jgi:hypothetical protein